MIALAGLRPVVWALLLPAEPCGAVDWISGARCSLAGGHHDGHASEDRDFEIRWPRA